MAGGARAKAGIFGGFVRGGGRGANRRLALWVGSGAVALLGAWVVPDTASAAPLPPTPGFGPSCDAFASYDAQDTCDPTAKPGTVSFRDFILGVYPSTGDYGITRSCSVGGTSEHKEGRAWDWKVNYYDAAQRDIAETVIDWLLATDEHGNACALARRTGMMYFIWNKQIWGSYRSPNSSCASAGWKSYTGSNPHTDHVHISWAWPGAKKQTTWWSAPLPTNQKPKGYLDGADCERVWGWSQDPDAPEQGIEVHLYFGGPAGDPNAEGVPLTADLQRDDLCDPLGSCKHGFEVLSPLSLHDGQPHAVHAYGIDSAGGSNPELSKSPGSFSCEPQVPPGIRRHVVDQDAFGAWGFSYFWDVMRIDDAALAAIDPGGDLPASPLLVKADDGSAEVWLIDGEVRRHVPSAEAFAVWGFDWADVVEWSAADVAAMTEGPPLRERPFLVQGSGAAVYLMDDALPSSGPGPGSGAGGGSGSGSGWAGAGAGSAAPGPGQQSRVIEDDASGCACRAAAPRRSPPSPLMLAALLALAVVRRRRG